MPYTLSPVSSDDSVALADPAANENRWTLNFGPQHPATHTTLRLVLELDGERIIQCTPHIGYLHSGFEKLGEHLNYNQYVTIVDRMDYSAPIYNELAWHGAAEKLMGIELTPRCKVLRTIAGELGRIQSHLLCVGAAGLDLGAFTAFLYGFNEREEIYDIVEYMTGQRFHTSWTRVGGLNMDLPDEAMFKKMVQELHRRRALPKAIEDVEKLLNKNRIFIDRTKGVGTITREEAIAWSLTGPMARASGVRRDIRKDEPYLCFADNWDGQGATAVDFKVPGHDHRRCLCPLSGPAGRDEADRMHHPATDRQHPRRPGERQPRRQGSAAAQGPGLQQHRRADPALRADHDQPRLRPPRKGEVYGCIETANGELGYYIVSAGENVPWRVRTRPPCFINYQVFPKLIEGHMISDVVAVLGSINVIAAELDR